ncbi:MAG: hypothetical protein AMS27_09895 [Bacteroides sp. SM23_62_1]|nr:MAG: hypothetical protein AMS27_09895 [Bacteroides sp. SM23_62_1]
MKKKFNLISFLIILSLPLLSQTILRGLDLEKLDEYIENAMNDWQIPGLSIAIVTNDTILHARGFGVRNIDNKDPVNENTLFAIASNTKAFTASSLAILVDNNKITWDDRVKDYLPWFELYDPYVSDEMRIRDLLCHRSGLNTFSGDLLWYGTIYSRKEIIEKARYLTPVFGFRYGYGYSNIMFLTAGEIIPVITDISWDDFLKKSFFDPLNMTRTTTTIRDLEKLGNFAQPHHVDLLKKETSTIPYVNWDNIGPAGSINSSVRDMAQWIRFQLNDGNWNGQQIISEKNIWEMRKIQNFQAQGRITPENRTSWHFRGYGLGWSVRDYSGLIIISHGGGADGMISQVTMIPEEYFGFVILTNSINYLPSALSEYILDTYFEGSSKDWSSIYLDSYISQIKNNEREEEEFARNRVNDTKPSLNLHEYTGLYGGDMYGDAEILLKNNQLVIRFIPTPIFTGTLTHWHFDIFRIKLTEIPSLPQGTVQFIINPDGEVEEMKIDIPNPDFDFTELEFRKKK